MSGNGRIPGPYGFEEEFMCVLNPMSYAHDGDPYVVSGHVNPGPKGTNKDDGEAAAEAAAKEAEKDREELERLVKVYGVVKNRSGGKSYVYWEKKKRKYRVDDYVKDRNAFFGSAKAYQEQLEAARTELDANKGRLRRMIEPPLGKRKNLPNWKAAQDVFYAWVRKAYQKQLGDDVDIPKLIGAQMSEPLKKALQQVKLDYGKQFQAGGFNPRPMKMNGYRLGTISEHAVGNAIDIDHTKNAHIPTGTWNAILKYTGKSVADPKGKWKTAPKELYDAIKAVNDEFVAKVAKAVKEVEAAAKAAEAAEAAKDAKAAAAPAAGAAKADAAKDKAAKTASAKPAAVADPLKAAIANDASLKAIGEAFVTRWRDGFFHMPWELVKELHEEGFLWGGTFSHPDLHHFELPKAAKK